MQNMQNIDMQNSKISESESSINSRTCLGHLVLLLNRWKVAIDNNGIVTVFGRITIWCIRWLSYDGISMVFSGTKHMMELPTIYLRTNIASLIEKGNRPSTPPPPPSGGTFVHFWQRNQKCHWNMYYCCQGEKYTWQNSAWARIRLDL